MPFLKLVSARLAPPNARRRLHAPPVACAMGLGTFEGFGGVQDLIMDGWTDIMANLNQKFLAERWKVIQNGGGKEVQETKKYIVGSTIQSDACAHPELRFCGLPTI